MKKFKSDFIIILLICSLILIIGVFYRTFIYNNYYRRPSVRKLEAAKLSGIGLTRLQEVNAKELSFNIHNPEQFELLSMIIGELKEGKIGKIIKSNEEFIHPGGITMLELYFKDGAVLRIKPAITYKKEIDNGSTTYRSIIIDNQITVYVSYLEEPIRIVAPKTCKLLSDNMGSIVELILYEKR